MAAFKDQHFVPKSYFKLFSQDGVFIGLYNLERKILLNVPLGSQCQKGYFYSDNAQLEKQFQNIEDTTLELLKRIISNGSFLNFSEDDFAFLRLFVLFQRGRTLSAKLHAEHASDVFAKEFIKKEMKNDPNFPKGITLKGLNSVKIIDKNAFNKILVLHLNAGILLRDLEIILIKNETENDFIFSDNPVVFFNEYLRRFYQEGSIGFQVPGLQIFCPVGPRYCLFFYDKQTYKFRFKIDNNLIRVFKKSDIAAINKLQFLDCESNIYFRFNADNKIIENMHSQLEYRKNNERKIITKDKLIQSIDLGTQRQRYTSYEMPNYELDLHFINEMPRFDSMPSMRSPHLYEPYKKLMEDLWANIKDTTTIEHQST